MSIFGVDNAVTTLGNHGTGRSNVFGFVVEDCTLGEICQKLDEITIVVNNIYQISIGNQSAITNNTTLIKKAIACCLAQDAKFDAIFASIIDLRRELLRGNRDIRR